MLNLIIREMISTINGEMINTIIGAVLASVGMLLGFLLELWKDKKKQKVQSKHAFLLLSNFF